ncbi:3-keto-disaccharide hydrolase [Flavihumibacter solisilvae]|uniref:Glycosyl hydrolase n=1 Tax=Flavihumibacter solisilvae TaxID=1349421 RepID=A0A0C1IR88_9BACT|nr:DUF1080 domain-containing protein [Flavihumibacter solisilvae]KIC92979.1 glycosyl hydrolase [Flavihumibacter solisilvae]
MIKRIFAFSATLAVLASCGSSNKVSDNAAADNTLSKQEKKEGWQLLFDGTSTKGWHTFGKTITGPAWKVDNGTLHLDASAKGADWQTGGGGDIVTEEAFTNYHLKLEWKISKDGNSGVIFNVQDEPAKYKYVWYTGPEMQVLDNNGHPDAKIHKHRAGDLYDLVASTPETVKPVGEWNLAEIIQNNGKLEFKLNGTTVVSTSYGDDAWKALVAGSKFKGMPDFGKFSTGKLALQDHGNDVWYKNIKILKL